MLVGFLSVLAAWIFTRADDIPVKVARFAIVMSAPISRLNPTADLAFFPDGTHIVFGGGSAQTAAGLYLRPIDQLDDARLRGADLTSGPFVSPDGQWIGSWADPVLNCCRRSL